MKHKNIHILTSIVFISLSFSLLNSMSRQAVICVPAIKNHAILMPNNVPIMKKRSHGYIYTPIPPIPLQSIQRKALSQPDHRPIRIFIANFPLSIFFDTKTFAPAQKLTSFLSLIQEARLMGTEIIIGISNLSYDFFPFHFLEHSQLEKLNEYADEIIFDAPEIITRQFVHEKNITKILVPNYNEIMRDSAQITLLYEEILNITRISKVEL